MLILTLTMILGFLVIVKVHIDEHTRYVLTYPDGTSTVPLKRWQTAVALQSLHGGTIKRIWIKEAT